MNPNPNTLSSPAASAPREGKREVNILFLGGAKRVSFGRKLIDAGNRMGLKVNIFSYELSLEVPIAAVGKVIVGLKWKDRKLMESLREAVETHKIDIILPFVDPAIEVAGKFVARNTSVWSPVVPIRLAHILFDKGEAATLFADNGIPVPPTYRGGRPKFPLIAKPRHGSASKGIFLVTDVTDFRRVCRMEGYMMEAYIENRVEYTVDAYISAKGRILCVSPLPAHRGSRRRGHTFEDCRLPRTHRARHTRHPRTETPRPRHIAVHTRRDYRLADAHGDQSTPRRRCRMLDTCGCRHPAPHTRRVPRRELRTYRKRQTRRPHLPLFR